MQHRPDPATVARKLLDELGLDAVVEAGTRAEACRHEADAEGVRFWNAVVRSVRLMEARCGAGSAGDRELAERVLWRLMQRVEHFRHRAAECRTRAANSPEPLRTELLEMERHWLELATYAEVLADQPPS